MKKPAQAYVLCSNPRSGTTLLCDMLAQTGGAGRPNSFFRKQSLEEWCADWNVVGPVDPLDPDFSRRYFAAMRREGRGDTPVFGLRLMGPDLHFAIDWIGRAYPGHGSAQAAFNAAFGPTRFIHLSRADKLAEAISLIRAEQTGLWHQRPDGSAYEQLEPTAQSGFDAERIRQRMMELQAYEKMWENWFAIEEISPLRLSYEALSADPPATLRQVLEYIGLDPTNAADIRPGVRKLADDTSADWTARYRMTFPED